MLRNLAFAVLFALRIGAEEEAFGEDDGEIEEADGGEYGGGYGGGGDDYGGGGGYGGDEYGGDEYGGGGGEDSTPAYELIDDLAGVQAFIDADPLEPAVIGFFDEERDAEQLATFQTAADASRYDFRFAYTIEDDVREAMKFTKGAAVLVYPPPRFVSDKFDKKRARFPSSKLDADTLKKFIYKKSVPLVGQKTWKSGDRYDKAGVPIVTLFAAIDLEKNSKGFDYFANRLRKVAVDYVGKLIFNVGDKEDFSYQLEDYGLELSEKKDVGVGCKDGNKHYKMTDKFNVDNLKAFAEAVLKGELTPKIKEESAADDHGEDEMEEEGGGSDYEDSEVVVLTAENFAAETEGKDAMLEFYAPWCGHCQSLKPVYKKLAAAFAGVATVAVAAMDATAHDPPAGIDVQGYPTVLFQPAGGEPVSYEGARDLKSMKQYIIDNAAHPISNDEL